ncbi:TetR/AcrR family transcriptional regulator [Nocardiopsis dassonvillei]|uniref:TetR/AcrR family transcriptional regulator n=1 Tax=Nocardiopsis dassonvillei TaxID=2014 RepID=UPI000B9D75E1|nr:TetR/AcrR family transcriptional regulator [Nocardiopsis dassonvillei]ASU58508.1 TetR family transcriptional regulator [Nocardiopsis dassonvillei]
MAPRGEDVKGRLLRAAAELISERGWSAVSTRTLADRAGVGPGLVHYHFPSLQALLTQAATQAITAIVEEAVHLLGPTTTPHQGLALILRELDRYPGDDPASHLVTETYLAATRDPHLRQAVTGVLDLMRRHLTDWLTHAGVPQPRQTATVLAATLDGVLLHRALTPDLTSTEIEPVLRRLLTHHTPGAHP